MLFGYTDGFEQFDRFGFGFLAGLSQQFHRSERQIVQYR
jgi:hypothetical protein